MVGDLNRQPIWPEPDGDLRGHVEDLLYDSC